ncbi:hypothetical protein EDC47_10638 [Raoultella planticola]|nr:hypothetical protein EDC47_10638 [Raoultella planticola]
MEKANHKTRDKNHAHRLIVIGDKIWLSICVMHV